MPQQDFGAAERQAIMRAREMYSRATAQNNEPTFHKQSAHNDNSFHNQKNLPPKNKSISSGNPLGMFFDGDMKLIIAMMLLLSGDGGDTLLLIALIYIMM